MLPLPQLPLPPQQTPAALEEEGDHGDGEEIALPATLDHENWEPFRVALGMMLMGGYLLLVAHSYLFVYFQVAGDGWRGRPGALSTMALLLVGLGGVAGLVLVVSAVLQARRVPYTSGAFQAARICMLSLFATAAGAIFLLYMHVDNELLRLRMVGAAFDENGFREAWSDYPLAWSEQMAWWTWTVTCIFLVVTTTAWLLVLVRAARHFRCLALARAVKVFLAFSWIGIVLLLAWFGTCSTCIPSRWQHLGPQYALEFRIEQGWRDVPLVHYVPIGLESPSASGSAWAWTRAFLFTGLVLGHQVLVLRVRQATFAGLHSPYQFTLAEIPSDWRLGGSGPDE